MTLARIPVPIQHPMLDSRTGLVTQPWAEYFQKIARQADIDGTGYMLKSVYDPTNSGSVVDSDKLDGQSASYYLNLANATGHLSQAKIRYDVQVITSDLTAGEAKWYQLDATGGDLTVTLPAANLYPAETYQFTRMDATANAISVVPDGSETINGATTLSIVTQYETYTLISDGFEWVII